MEKSYEEMSIEELEAANQALMLERADLRARQLAIAAALDEKRKAREIAEALLRIESKYPSPQVLQPVGIDSAEKVNGA